MQCYLLGTKGNRCKLLIHFNLIIIVHYLSPYIVESFCTALSCTESSCIEYSLSSHSLWIKNKLHHHNISKSNMLSLLSTAVVLVHGPLLLRGVVNPWQTKSGTQCGSYGQWIEPFTYQYDVELLHDITSHPAIKQYQQITYVSWQASDTKSHTKNGFLPWENSRKHMTFPKWLTYGSAQSHHTLH